MFDLTPATQEERDSLVLKCQENGWLKRGGFDWQDDPYLEDYPYEFSRASTIDDLSDFFRSGNWAIRQGVLFGDLAFVNQVNGGDEWWTLKRDFDGSWVQFESMSLGRIASDRSDFIRHIACMQIATIEECRRLDYLPPDTSLVWEGAAFPGPSEGYVHILGNCFELDIVNSAMGKLVTMAAEEEVLADLDSRTCSSMLTQVIAAVESYEKGHARHAEGISGPLSDRARNAIDATEGQQHWGHSDHERDNER